MAQWAEMRRASGSATRSSSPARPHCATAAWCRCWMRRPARRSPKRRPSRNPNSKRRKPIVTEPSSTPSSAHSPSVVEFATRRRVTIAMMTITLVLFGADRTAQPQGQPAAGPELSDADRAHRIHRRGADRNRNADQPAGRGSRRRGQGPAQAQVGVAHRAERRRARVRLGHRHGPGQPGSARQDGSRAAAAGSQGAGAAALQSVDAADPAPGAHVPGSRAIRCAR